MNQDAAPAVLVAPACGRSAVARIAFRDAPIAAARDVAFGDIADLAALPPTLRERASRLRIPLARGAASIRTAAISARAKALIPILRCWPMQAAPVTLAIRHAAPPLPNDVRIVPPDAAAQAAPVRPGETISLTTRAGPVRVARDVEALQAARAGQRLFVRAADGTVMSVRYAGSPR